MNCIKINIDAQPFLSKESNAYDDYEFTFLDYVDNFTGDAPHIVKNASQMTVDELAEFSGFHQDTIKGWFKSNESSRKKIPTRHSWNLLIYMLEAKRKGYTSLSELIKKTESI